MIGSKLVHKLYTEKKIERNVQASSVLITFIPIIVCTLIMLILNWNFNILVLKRVL